MNSSKLLAILKKLYATESQAEHDKLLVQLGNAAMVARIATGAKMDEIIKEFGFKVPPRAEPQATGKSPGKFVRQSDGRVVFYRGDKRDYSGEPFYLFYPENVMKAVQERRLRSVDLTYASLLYQFIRQSMHYKKDKSQRINMRELAAMLGLKTHKDAQESVSRMVKKGELLIESSGVGRQDGAIYRFPARPSEHAKGSSLRASEHGKGSRSNRTL